MGRMPIIHKMLQQLGIEKERFRLEWISASEGERVAEVANEMAETLKKSGPINLKHE